MPKAQLCCQNCIFNHIISGQSFTGRDEGITFQPEHEHMETSYLNKKITMLTHRFESNSFFLGIVRKSGSLLHHLQ